MRKTATASVVAVLVGALSATAVASDAASATERRSKSLSSTNALWQLQMVELGDRKCRLEAKKDREIAWVIPKCLGSADDLYFISSDGSRFWVVRTLPLKPGPRKKKKGNPWSRVSVATLYDSMGEVLEGRVLTQFVPTKKIGELKQLTKRFRWLEGVAGERGVLPRLNAQGQVEFETVLGETHRLQLEMKN